MVKHADGWGHVLFKGAWDQGLGIGLIDVYDDDDDDLGTGDHTD